MASEAVPAASPAWGECLGPLAACSLPCRQTRVKRGVVRPPVRGRRLQCSTTTRHCQVKGGEASLGRRRHDGRASTAPDAGALPAALQTADGGGVRGGSARLWQAHRSDTSPNETGRQLHVLQRHSGKHRQPASHRPQDGRRHPVLAKIGTRDTRVSVLLRNARAPPWHALPPIVLVVGDGHATFDALEQVTELLPVAANCSTRKMVHRAFAPALRFPHAARSARRAAKRPGHFLDTF